jgi:signal transduction histidine kinase
VLLSILLAGLSLIAVSAELASRLSAEDDRAAAAEREDAQRLARQPLRDVREAVTGTRAPRLEAELAVAKLALRTAGIGVRVESLRFGFEGLFYTRAQAACSRRWNSAWERSTSPRHT